MFTRKKEEENPLLMSMKRMKNYHYHNLSKNNNNNNNNNHSSLFQCQTDWGATYHVAYVHTYVKKERENSLGASSSFVFLVVSVCSQPILCLITTR